MHVGTRCLCDMKIVTFLCQGWDKKPSRNDYLPCRSAYAQYPQFGTGVPLMDSFVLPYRCPGDQVRIFAHKMPRLDTILAFRSTMGPIRCGDCPYLSTCQLLTSTPNQHVSTTTDRSSATDIMIHIAKGRSKMRMGRACGKCFLISLTRSTIIYDETNYLRC